MLEDDGMGGVCAVVAVLVFEVVFDALLSFWDLDLGGDDGGVSIIIELLFLLLLVLLVVVLSVAFIVAFSADVMISQVLY